MENLRERNAVDVLHDEDETNLWILDKIDDTCDVIASNAPEQVCLASKPCNHFLVIRGRSKQRLDRHPHADR